MSTNHKYENIADITPQILDRVQGFNILEQCEVKGTITRIRSEEVIVAWDDGDEVSGEPLWFMARERTGEIIRYKESSTIPALGDIVEPYDRFFRGTVIEIINEYFVCVDWKRWATEKHIEVEFTQHIYFVKRGE